MRRSRLIGGGGVAIAAAFAWWRRHPRFGSGYVNRVIDPWLVRHGIVDRSGGEIGLLEHVGRRSGAVRTSPVHPVRTDDGFRIVVPLGVESHWAQNVLAAGHCRIQIGDVVHELDEPVLVVPSSVEGISPVIGRLMDWLGFRYLLLHRFAEHPGLLAELAPRVLGEPRAVPVAVD
jgi:deazaflavin-dependent oxidoreductase (nitroreductase family)